MIEAAYERAYRPFVEAMARRPRIKFAMHVSGCLWDWLLARRPAFVGLLKPLVERGQVELVSGAYYEPVFPAIPEEDLVGQIEKLNDFLRDTFGVVPRGAWLAERVWEPHLPALLARAGIEWTTVDDWHLLGAGVPREAVHGAFTTDHDGRIVRLLPIDEALRYAVPFKEPAETLARLERIAAAAPAGTLPAGILMDDGEKFGVWPETHDWVYVRGWLDRFLDALEAADWVQCLTPSEYLAQGIVRGPVYVGAAAYSEMMTWALPPDAQRALAAGRAALERGGVLAAAGPFLKGGTWRSFQARYPEANWLHKKMLRVSAKVRAAARARPAAPEVAAAREALWRGQCNCPYWHGVFGGLYLNALRHAAWRNLIEAERLADRVLRGDGAWIAVEEVDADADGAKEIVVDTDRLSVLVRPAEGGSLGSLEVRAKGWNVLDVLARRDEVYHDRLREAVAAERTGDGAGGGARSIHDLVRVKEPGLERYLGADDRPRRGALQDRLLVADADFSAWRDGTAEVVRDLFPLPYEASVVQGGSGTDVMLSARISMFGGSLGLGKRIRAAVGRASLSVAYSLDWTSRRPFAALCCSEWHAGLLAADADDRYVLFDGKKPVDSRAASEGEAAAACVEAVDGWQGVRLRWTFPEPVRVWRRPVWTVSLSEGGFERTYQGTCFAFVRPLELAPGASSSWAFEFDVLDL